MAKKTTPPKPKKCDNGIFLISVDSDEHFVFHGDDFSEAIEYAGGMNVDTNLTIRRIPDSDWARFVQSVTK